MDLVCLGELLIDMFPAELGRPLTEVSAFHPKPGGGPANVAVAARRLTSESGFIGKVGDDLFGHYLERVLASEGVDTRGLRYDTEARTTMAIIGMPDEDTAEFVFYRNPGADTRLRADELDRDLLRDTRALHFGSLSLTHQPARGATIQAARVAGEAGALISFDVNYRPTLWESDGEAMSIIEDAIPAVDLLKVNEAELALLTGESLETGSQALLELGPELVVVTLGRAGSYFRFAGGGEHVPGFEVDTVDAIGCGDAFVAGLLITLVAEQEWRRALNSVRLRGALRYANAVGAMTALGQGVIPALPTAVQVEEFLRNQEDATKVTST